MQNGAQFYLQVVGTQTNNTDVKFGSNWIYTANGTGGAYGVGSTVNNNTTYALTYYATAGNPFGTNYPSYTIYNFCCPFLSLHRKKLDLCLLYS